MAAERFTPIPVDKQDQKPDSVFTWNRPGRPATDDGSPGRESNRRGGSAHRSTVMASLEEKYWRAASATLSIGLVGLYFLIPFVR